MKGGEIVLFIPIFVAVVLNILVLALPDWYRYRPRESIYTHAYSYGFFQKCFQYEDWECQFYRLETADTFVKVTGIFLLISGMAGVACMLLSALVICMPQTSKADGIVSARNSSAFAGVSSALAVCIWLGTTYDQLEKGYNGPAIWLAIFIPILCLLHTGLSIPVAKRVKKELDPFEP